MRRCCLYGLQPLVLITPRPATIRISAYAQFGTGDFQARTIGERFIDQLYGVLAIQGAGQSSSSPQIARAFFRKASKAAVSASAASFR